MLYCVHCAHSRCKGWMTPGPVDGAHCFQRCWYAVQASHSAQASGGASKPETQASNWQVMVMLPVNSQSKAAGSPHPEDLSSPHAEMLAIPVPMPLIVAVSTCRLEVDKDLRQAGAKKRLQSGLQHLVQVRCLANLPYLGWMLSRGRSRDCPCPQGKQRCGERGSGVELSSTCTATRFHRLLLALAAVMQGRFEGTDKVPVLDPVKDMGVQSESVNKALQCLTEVDAKLAGNALMQQESTKEQQLLAKLQDLAMERAALKVHASCSCRTVFHAKNAGRAVNASLGL